MPFLIIGFILIVAIFVYSNYSKKQLKANIERKKDFVSSFSPNARIIVNNGNYLFFMDDVQQVFGVDDSGKTYSYAGLHTVITHKDAISIGHDDVSYKGLEIGKSPFPDDVSIALDSHSISTIKSELMPILRKNLHKALAKRGITPTHEYEHKGIIWGCDINSRMFYNTYAYFQIHSFSKLSRVTVEEVRNTNSNSNYIMTIYIKQDGDWDEDETDIYFDEQDATFYNLSAMFKGIKERQNSFDIANAYNNFDMMEGHEFEFFCAKLLKNNGYKNVSVTQGSGDQGVDIIAYKDDIKYGIQCKCYHSDIGNKAVQEVYAGKAFYNCHVGIVLTNRNFTRSAIELAQNNGVILWDRKKLLQMIDNCKENMR